MEMSGLQRSTTSFRRQGSSGLVWDNTLLSGDLNRMKLNDNYNQENKEKRGSDGMNNMMRRSRSKGGGGRMYRKTKEAESPSVDPPSPKVSGCGFCGVFGKPDAAKKRRSDKRKS
ncbi:hypothetical protein PTKIN_Ptkin03bG0256600 [Pterospermum kingtungense]